MEASREKDLEKQIEILQKATEEGKTVREIRHELKEEKAKETENVSTNLDSRKNLEDKTQTPNTFRKWDWASDDEICHISVCFRKKHSMEEQMKLLGDNLQKAFLHSQRVTGD